MNRTLLGLVVAVAAMGAQVAHADDYYGGDGDYHPSVPAQVQGNRHCGTRPSYAPQGQTMQQGQYQMQNVQRWVPGVQQQVWVPGECRGNGGGWHHGRGRWGRQQQQCSQGYYTTVTTPGHYETTQEWVWVSNGYPQQQQYGQYQQQYGAGYQYQNTSGTFSVSVY
jgi:hypothetical protein